MPAYAKKRDNNEPGIIDALVEAGAHVTQLGDFGVPDLLVGYKLKTYLLEVKGELGPRGGGTGRDLTEAQIVWWNGGKRLRKHHKPLPPWADVGGPANIVRTPEEALAAIGAYAAPVELPPAWWLCRVQRGIAWATARVPAHLAIVSTGVKLDFGDPNITAAFDEGAWTIRELLRPCDSPGMGIGWRAVPPNTTTAITLSAPDQAATTCATCESGDAVMALRLPWPAFGLGSHNHATTVHLCAACRATAAAVLVSR